MVSLGKQAELTALLHKLQQHFAFLTETWLDTTLENSDLSAGGSFSVIGRQDRIQGQHGGTLILQNTSNTSCAEFLGNPVISNVDFCNSALIKVDDRLVLFILVYLSPQGSQYEVTTTCLASVLHHGSTFLLNFNENISFEYRHICLLGDITFPKTDWSTFSSSSARETSFLNILDDYESCTTILSSTHNRGNSLDNILVPSSITGCFDCHVLPLTPFSDHAPISAKIYTKSSPPSLRIRNYAFTEPGIVTFYSRWQSYTFPNYPSADTIADFYHHLHVSVKESFRSETRKSGRPCQPTNHPILCIL